MGSLRPKYTFQMREYTKSTAQKMKFSIKDFFSKCDQIRSKVGEKTCYIEWIIAQSELFVRMYLKRFYYSEKGELTDVQV